jgi:hypothetical protein
MHAVNHAAGAEKHQRFEERVSHHVEDANRKAPTPHAMNMKPS